MVHPSDLILIDYFGKYPTSKCWPETRRPPDICPAKMGIFEINRRIAVQGLQTCWATCKSPQGKGRRRLSYRGEGRWEGSSKQSPWVFILLVPAEKEGDPFFCVDMQVWELPLLVSRLYLIEWVKITQLCPTFCSPMDCQGPLSREFSRPEYWSG